MPDPALIVSGLSKKYRLGLTHAGSLSELASRLTHRLRGRAPAGPEAAGVSAAQVAEKGREFWALQDVSFQVQPGEVVGIIGRNGAGKSTLLKVLSRVTTPTEGRIEINGRVGSLLEVGTGFHPELTGRENVYMNGTLLGMSRREVTAKLDEIIIFAGVGKFLDTPVKRYSSGMKVRLGFAVAAHLEPEVLIVDEVLAVGDAEFQKKCLGKMKEVAGAGRTVLFVSHNIGAVSQLCTRGIVLDTGRVICDAACHEAIRVYMDHGMRHDAEIFLDAAAGHPEFHFVRVAVVDQQGKVRDRFRTGDRLELHLEYVVSRQRDDLEISFQVLNSLGSVIFSSLRSETIHDSLRQGHVRNVVQLPTDLLSPGTYSLRIAAHRPNVEIYQLLESPIVFSLEDSGTALSRYQGDVGVIRITLPWNEQLGAANPGPSVSHSTHA